jgi:hypothetical protein
MEAFAASDALSTIPNSIVMLPSVTLRGDIEASKTDKMRCKTILETAATIASSKANRVCLKNDIAALKGSTSNRIRTLGS